MSKPKAAAKAVAVVDAAPKDWPADLDDTKAQELFDLVESGDFTVKTAAAELGLKGNTVYQWKRRYERFGQRLAEAEDIGIDMAIDGYRQIKAHDRDSAAGANIAIQVIDKYLHRKRPERFHINPFKPAAGNTEMLLGVVVVPAKQPMLASDTIDAEFTTIDVPAKVPT